MNPYLTPTIRQRRNRGDFGQRGAVRHAERISFERRHGATVPRRITGREFVIATLVIVIFLCGSLWLAAHDPGYLSRSVQQTLEGAK
jgi:hypothetical protein